MPAHPKLPPSRLEQILAHTRSVVDLRKSLTNIAVMERAAAAHIPRGFLRAVREKSSQSPAIIAELKKASPSKGTIRENLNVPALARDLEAAGAICLSVLTEEKWFLGSLANLREASAATHLPCLRKDFTIDEFQITEARANHADAVLLIAAALDDAALQHLARSARAQDLDIVCEIHNREELDRVLSLNFDPAITAIGVNSRNLHTFAVSLAETAALADVLTGSGYLLIAESGITTAADIAKLRNHGYSAFLIGESLMRAPHPGEYLRQLLQICG